MARGARIALDLFCGCGGLTEGLKQAGFHVIGAVDIDALSVETYRANHPEVLTWERDIRNLDVATVKRMLVLRAGELDLLAGCPPCQGFSTLRTLRGARPVEDIRNDLVSEFIRFAEELAPRAIMIENVPGLAQDRRMRELVTALSALGYVGEPRVLDAADYGVPQRRARMILVACKGAAVSAAPTAKVRRTVRDAIGRLRRAGESGDPLHDLPERRSEKVANRIRRIPKDGGSRTSLGPDDQLPCHRKCTGFRDVYGRMAWDTVAPTITGGCFNPSKGRFLHPEQARAITMREAALLQSFPPSYRFSLRRGKSGVAQMVGNALPPEFVRQQGARVLDHLDHGG